MDGKSGDSVRCPERIRRAKEASGLCHVRRDRRARPPAPRAIPPLARHLRSPGRWSALSVKSVAASWGSPSWRAIRARWDLRERHTLPVAQIARQRQALGIERPGACHVAGMVERLAQIAESEGGPRHVVELPPEGQTLLVPADRLPRSCLKERQRAEARQTRRRCRGCCRAAARGSGRPRRAPPPRRSVPPRAPCHPGCACTERCPARPVPAGSSASAVSKHARARGALPRSCSLDEAQVLERARLAEPVPDSSARVHEGLFVEDHRARDRRLAPRPARQRHPIARRESGRGRRCTGPLRARAAGGPGLH